MRIRQGTTLAAPSRCHRSQLSNGSASPGDLLFIVGSIVPVVYLALRMFNARNRTAPQETGESPRQVHRRKTPA